MGIVVKLYTLVVDGRVVRAGSLLHVGHPGAVGQFRARHLRHLRNQRLRRFLLRHGLMVLEFRGLVLL